MPVTSVRPRTRLSRFGILIDKAELLVGSRANLPERPDPERLERRERELDELERRRLARSKRT